MNAERFFLNAISFAAGFISGGLGAYWWIQSNLSVRLGLMLFAMSTLGFIGGWFRAAARYGVKE